MDRLEIIPGIWASDVGLEDCRSQQFEVAIPWSEIVSIQSGRIVSERGIKISVRMQRRQLAALEKLWKEKAPRSYHLHGIRSHWFTIRLLGFWTPVLLLLHVLAGCATRWSDRGHSLEYIQASLKWVLLNMPTLLTKLPMGDWLPLVTIHGAALVGMCIGLISHYRSLAGLEVRAEHELPPSL